MQPLGHRIQPSHRRSTGRDVVPSHPAPRSRERIGDTHQRRTGSEQIPLHPRQLSPARTGTRRSDTGAGSSDHDLPGIAGRCQPRPRRSCRHIPQLLGSQTNLHIAGPPRRHPRPVAGRRRDQPTSEIDSHTKNSVPPSTPLSFTPQGESGLHKIIHKVGPDSTGFARTGQPRSFVARNRMARVREQAMPAAAGPPDRARSGGWGSPGWHERSRSANTRANTFGNGRC